MSEAKNMFAERKVQEKPVLFKCERCGIVRGVSAHVYETCGAPMCCGQSLRTRAMEAVK